jgi:hypothetical protein
LSITSRVPKGTTCGSTETLPRELGLPEAVTPLPEWQVTSNTPSSMPRAPVVLVGANFSPARVVPGGEAGGGFPVLQAARRTPAATAPSNATLGAPHAAAVASADRHGGGPVAGVSGAVRR